MLNFITHRHKIYFTSVSGHLKTFSFPESCKNWNETPLDNLYNVELQKEFISGNQKIVSNLWNLGKHWNQLILWLDCDREGEAIAFDVLESIQQVNPDIEYYRAKFSAVTEKDVTYAMKSLVKPDRNLSNAVSFRQEIDLRIGASYTRFQTINLAPITGDRNQILSYGPCQFPTLGFVVDRWDEVNNFIPENFWSLKLKKQFKVGDKRYNVRFNWKKERLYDQQEWEQIYNHLLQIGKGSIDKVIQETKYKIRPQPLNTVELQKLLSRHFNLSGEVSMNIAEKLYNKGLISYPRTETTIYSK